MALKQPESHAIVHLTCSDYRVNDQTGKLIIIHVVSMHIMISSSGIAMIMHVVLKQVGSSLACGRHKYALW